MTALDHLIAALDEADAHYYFGEPRPGKEQGQDYWEHLLAATPAEVIIEYLVERGVLEAVTLPHGNHTISVYQRKDMT